MNASELEQVKAKIEELKAEKKEMKDDLQDLRELVYDIDEKYRKLESLIKSNIGNRESPSRREPEKEISTQGLILKGNKEGSMNPFTGGSTSRMTTEGRTLGGPGGPDVPSCYVCCLSLSGTNYSSPRGEMMLRNGAEDPPGWSICRICKNPLCNDCSKISKCKLCAYPVCLICSKTHSCSICNASVCRVCTLFCKQNKCRVGMCLVCAGKLNCSVCRAPLCRRCMRDYPCAKCANIVCEQCRSLCPCGRTCRQCDSKSVCKYCKQLLCKKCEKVLMCGGCKKSVCSPCKSTSQVECPRCHKHSCPGFTCTQKCGVCKQLICATCILKCAFCDKKICSTCIQGCTICKEQICALCHGACITCKGSICKECERVCKICKHIHCSNCLKHSCRICRYLTCQSCRINCETEDINTHQLVFHRLTIKDNSTWSTSATKFDAISIMSQVDIMITGVSIYSPCTQGIQGIQGVQGEALRIVDSPINVHILIKKMSVVVVDRKIKVGVQGEGQTTIPIMFPIGDRVELRAGNQAEVGVALDTGMTLSGDKGVTTCDYFVLQKSIYSTNGSDLYLGQIPQIYFVKIMDV